ncbi:MAG: glycosyltransferase family 2 protein [Planctomycetota bacterium]|nr:glycosyltransferase family 2 protein [Planctomycetota bacterium]
MSAGPRIACVIPAYNRERSLGRAIESALNQSFPPAEVLVADDGSTDRSVEIARGYGDRVRVLLGENGGAAVARNRGVTAATAEWIAFLDSDDYWTEDHLEHVRAAIEGTHGRCDLYFADMQRPSSEGTIRQFDLCEFPLQGAFQAIDDATPWVLRARIPMMLQASVVKRATFLELGGLWDDLRRRHDTHLFVRFGIGRSACAVNHVGTIMTADEDAGRLTVAMQPGSEKYWSYSRMLWSDLHERFAAEDRAAGSPLRYRQFQASWQLARRRIKRLHPSGLVDLMRALTLSPPLFVASCVRRRPAEADFVRRNGA